MAAQHEVGASDRDLRQQLEWKTLILDAVAHDLRTRLTIIWGMASTLCGPHSSGLSDAERDLWLSRIASNAQRIDAILTNLLSLESESGAGLSVRRSPTDVLALARRVAAELDDHDHPIEIPEGKAVVAIDPFLVERVLENLLANAVRHTPAGTAVRVEVTASSVAVEIVVDDDGPGVTIDMRDDVFDRFSTDGSLHAGVGLGLSLVKRLARLHGGDAWLGDGAGGASFHVVLSTDERLVVTRSPAYGRDDSGGASAKAG